MTRTRPRPQRRPPFDMSLARPVYGAVKPLAGPHAGRTEEPGESMATYQMVYGDADQVVTERFEDIDSVEREEGWVVLFRGPEAILRVQEAHVQSLERLCYTPRRGAPAPWAGGGQHAG